MRKIAIPFKLMNNEWNDRPDIEFNIPYDDSRDKELEKFLDFIDLYPNTRINLEFKNEINFQHLKIINKASDNIYVRLGANQLLQMKSLSENGYKFFLGKDLMVYNYASLASFIKFGVTDVYIGDDLCYNLKEVKEFCDAANVKLRLVLNRIPMSTIDRGQDPTGAIFRPEDVYSLKQYFDTYEFDCGKPYNWKRHRVLYTTYFVKSKWNGDLREINPDIKFPLLDNCLSDDFSYYKFNCGRKCLKLENGYYNCSICYKNLDMAKKLESLSIIRKNNKARNKNTLKMHPEAYERINKKLASIGKDNPEAEKYKELFDTLEIPVFWVAGKACYQLDPCVIDDNEGCVISNEEGESE